MVRKIFNYDNLAESKVVVSLRDVENMYERSVSACGCLLYKYINDIHYVLVASYTNPQFPLLDDLGGKVEETDETLFDAMAREVAEETNFVISPTDLQILINSSQSIHTLYNPICKYHLTLVEVSEDYLTDTSVFGTLEITNQIGRTLQWRPLSECTLAQRIATLPIQELLEKIE